ncbi:hypothetical protein ABFX02_04G052900 [Erythranthe guttata]
MGKHIRKPKTPSDVAVKEVSQSSIGVRTRAKTLALQRLQSTTAAAADSSPPPKHDFLELRSRRLEKPPLLRKDIQNYRKAPAPEQGFVSRDKEDSRNGSSPEKPPCCESGFPIEPCKEVDSEIEASLGENNLDLEARERSTRESTPCSLIRAGDAITAPGSSTKQRTPSAANQRVQNALQNMPTAREMEEFFAEAELQNQRLFIDKYNFDVVNDMPLPGRYEWVRVTP